MPVSETTYCWSGVWCERRRQPMHTQVLCWNLAVIARIPPHHYISLELTSHVSLIADLAQINSSSRRTYSYYNRSCCSAQQLTYVVTASRSSSMRTTVLPSLAAAAVLGSPLIVRSQHAAAVCVLVLPLAAAAVLSTPLISWPQHVAAVVMYVEVSQLLRSTYCSRAACSYCRCSAYSRRSILVAYQAESYCLANEERQ